MTQSYGNVSMVGTVTDSIYDLSLYPDLDADLSSTGYQYASGAAGSYSGAVNIGTGTYTTIKTFYFAPKISGVQLWSYGNFDFDLKCSHTGAKFCYKWEAGNSGTSNYVALHSGASVTVSGATYVHYDMKGYFNLQSGIENIPFAYRARMLVDSGISYLRIGSGTRARSVFRAKGP